MLPTKAEMKAVTFSGVQIRSAKVAPSTTMASPSAMMMKPAQRSAIWPPSTDQASIEDGPSPGVQNRAAVDAAVSKRFAALDHDEAVRLLVETDTAFADVNGIGDLLTHPHLTQTDIDTETGPQTIPAPAAVTDGKRHAGHRVPGLGADSAAIREEFAPGDPRSPGAGAD